MSDAAPDPRESEDFIDAGAVDEIQELRFRADRHRAQTSRWLAFVIVGLLAATVAAHYSVAVWLHLSGRSDATAAVGRIFEVWLPIISGLSSAAVTYYFTKERGA
jgi:hypothetical protein